MKKIVVFFVFLFSPVVLYADFEFKPPCALGSAQDYSLTLFGDSRAFTLGERENQNGKNYIKNSELEHDGHTRRIFSEDADIETLNLGWPGAGIDIAGMSWPERYDYCIEDDAPYILPENIILNLGGNDIIKFYNKVEEAEALYLLSGIGDTYKNAVEALYDTYQTLIDVVNGGKPDPDDIFEAYWYWQFDVKADSLHHKMENFAETLLNDNPSRLMLVDIGPVTGPAVYDYIAGNGGDGLIPREVRMNVYVSRMNVIYYHKLFPDLLSKYGNRVYFVDVFNRFLRNIIEENSSFYIPAETLTDENFSGTMIHYNNSGDKEFGRIVSTAMAYHGWYSKNPDFTDDQLSDYFSGEPVDLSYLVPDTDDDCDVGCVIVVCGVLGCL